MKLLFAQKARNKDILAASRNGALPGTFDSLHSAQRNVG